MRMLFLSNFGSVTTNVWWLGEVTDFKALTFNLELMFI